VSRWGMIAIALACVVSGRAFAQDVAAGEKAFVVCRACHQIGPNAKIAVGPVLNGIVGRKAGTYPGYSYSTANKDSGLTWDDDTLLKYLADTQAVV
jgi:cytochrome c